MEHSISEPAKIMIYDIVKKMEHAVKSYTDSTIVVHSPFTELKKGIHYEHIVEKIKMDIENLPKIGKQFSFSIGSRHFNIYLIKPLNKNMYNKSSFEKDCLKKIRKIYVWLSVVCQFANPICSPNLDIYIYLTDHKKKLPENTNEPLDEIHANTAFTMACPIRANEIYIFREEEWFKVLIHESFHSFGLDFAVMSEKETNVKLFSIFPVITDGIRFYEAYTEFWAEVINIVFISVNSFPCNMGSSLDMEFVFDTIRSHLYNEQIFSLFQCAKVLNHFGLKYRELYDSSQHAIHMRNALYREKTQVFSYYILKCIMMYYYNDFIELCYKNNNQSIQFIKTQSNINSFIDFIKKRHNSAEFLRTIGIFEDWFSKNRGIKYKDKDKESILDHLFCAPNKRNGVACIHAEKMETMRMSITE